MAETSNTYITCYIKKGKVVELFFLNSQDEATTMEALGRKKGYETETLVMTNDWLPSRSVTEVESTLYVSPKKQKVKKYWDRPVKCVETGQVFKSIRECCDHLGLSYKSVWNAINSGNARDGYHFVFEEQRLETWGNVEHYTGSPRQRKILCVTNGICYDSVKDCLRDCHLPVNSFYRALHSGSFIKGLLFRYAE